MTRWYLKLFFLAVIIITVFTFAESGRAITERNYKGSLITNIKPANPGPNENVSISLVSFEANLDQSNITWKVNGKEERSGVGERNFNFRTGESGTNYTIDIQVGDSDNILSHKQLSFSLADIDLIWEAATYMPPLYQGHSQITDGSLVKLVALPRIKDLSGKSIDPKDLIYIWRRNNLSQPKYSGPGQNTIIFKSNDSSGSDILTVNISTADKQINVSKTVNLNSVNPKVIFYPTVSGQVDFNNALKQSVDLKEGSMTLHAVPFFFSLSDNLSSLLSYDWRQNGAALQNSPDQPTELTFTVDKGMQGVSSVDLLVKNKGVLMQSASNNLKINFGQ